MPLRPANSSGEPPAPFAGTGQALDGWPRTIRHEHCPTCKALIETGLCGYGCDQDGDNNRESTVVLTYTLTKVHIKTSGTANVKAGEEIEPAGGKQFALGGKK
jgi:hypothetical protein